MNRFRAVLAALTAILAVTALASCADSGPRFVNEGSMYTAENVATVLDLDVTSSAAGKPTSEAPKLRQEALVNLRKQGGDAAAAADILTKTFANSSPGVPYYVEKATFDDTESLVIAEVIGPKNGTLEDKRIWVIDGTGEILYSGTR